MAETGMRSPERSRPRGATPKSAPTPVPTLNKYARSRVPKGESANYLELLKAMQDATKGGGSTAKSSLPKLLPALCKFGDLPSAAVPILLAITKLPDKKDEGLRKLQRCAYYLLQVTLGVGAAGTPQPYSSTQPDTARSSVPLGLASPAWKEAAGQVVNSARQRLALRLLAATARASVDDSTPDGEGAAITELQRVVDQLILALAGPNAGKQAAPRSGLFGGKGPASAGTQTEKCLAGEGAAAMRSALAAVRVGAQPYPPAMSELCVAGYDGLPSSDAVGVRHALALAATAAVADPVQAVERTGPLLKETLKRFGTHGTLFLPPILQQAKSAKRSGKASAAVLQLDDPFARVYVARLSAAVAHSNQYSSSPARQQAEPFWHALVLLATRDPSDLVVMEAIRQMAGGASRALPPPSASCPSPSPIANRSSAALEAKGLPAFSPTAKAMERTARASDVQGREGRSLGARAWMMILKETLRSTLPSTISSPHKAGNLPTAPGERADKPSETLISYVVARLRAALKSRHAPLVCSAAKTAAALCEARALAVEVHGLAAQGESFVVKAMDLLLKELQTVLEGRADASQRCYAMSAVIWMQLPGRTPLMSPAAMHRHAASGGPAPGSPQPWPPCLIQRLLRCLLDRLQTSHALAAWVLRCTVAVAAASPSGTDPEQLTLLWAAALQCGAPAASAALRAAFELLDSPPAPTTASSPREAVAWSRLKRVAAWWLGANANLAAGEVAWESAAARSGGGDASDLQLLLESSQRSPVMGTVISQLQSAMLTGAWQVRVAAAQALGKVAIRSGEPYRLQCYAILRGAVALDGAESDPMGLTSTVMPILRILDACYSSASVLQRCISQWGNNPEEWPPRHLASLRARHQQLLADICAKVCYVPPALFLPLGPASAPLVQSATEASSSHPYGRSMSGSELEGLMAAGSVPASVLSGLEGSGLEELLEEAPETPSYADESDAGAGARCDSNSIDGGWSEDVSGKAGGSPVEEDDGSIADGEFCSEGSSPEMMPTLSEGVSVTELQANAAVLRATEKMEGSEEADDKEGAEPAAAAALVAARAVGRQGSVDADAFEFDSPSASGAVKGGEAADDGGMLLVSDLDGQFALGSLFGGGSTGVGVMSVMEGVPVGAMDSSREETDLSFNDLAADSQAGDVSLDSVAEPKAAVGSSAMGGDVNEAALISGSAIATPTEGCATVDSAPLPVNGLSATGVGMVGDAFTSFDSEPPLSSVDTSVVGADGDDGMASFDGAAPHLSTAAKEPASAVGDVPPTMANENNGLEEASLPSLADSTPPDAVAADAFPEVTPPSIENSTTDDPFAAFDSAPFPPEAQSDDAARTGDRLASLDSAPLPQTFGVGSTLTSFNSAPLPPAAQSSVDACPSFDSAPFPPAAALEPSTNDAGLADPFASFDDNSGLTPTASGTFMARASSSAVDPGGDAFEAFGSTPFPSVDPFTAQAAEDSGFVAAFHDAPQPTVVGNPVEAKAGTPPSSAHVHSSSSITSQEAHQGNGFGSSWSHFGGSPPQSTAADTFVDFGTSSSAVPPRPSHRQVPPQVDTFAAFEEASPVASVVYSFTAEEAGEVSVCAGQTVSVVTTTTGASNGDGWSRIRLEDGSTGVVPTNYLNLGSYSGDAQQQQLELEAVAEYDFTGEAAGELSVRAGDQLAVRSEVDGWYEVFRGRDGAAGLVPVTYVSPVSKPSHVAHRLPPPL